MGPESWPWGRAWGGPLRQGTRGTGDRMALCWGAMPVEDSKMLLRMRSVIWDGARFDPYLSTRNTTLAATCRPIPLPVTLEHTLFYRILLAREFNRSTWSSGGEGMRFPFHPRPPLKRFPTPLKGFFCVFLVQVYPKVTQKVKGIKWHVLPTSSCVWKSS